MGSAVREETGRGPHTSLAGRLVVLAKNRAGQVSVHLRGATRAPPPCKCCSLGTIKPSAVVREETDTRKGLPSDRKQASPPRHRSLSIAQPRGPRGDSEKEQIATGAPARRYHSSMSIHRWKEPLEYVNNAQGPGVRATSFPPPPHERQQASGVAAGVRVPRSFTCSTSFIAPLPPVTAFAAGRVAAMPRFCLPSLRWGVVIGKQHGEIIRTIFFYSLLCVTFTCEAQCCVWFTSLRSLGLRSGLEGSAGSSTFIADLMCTSEAPSSTARRSSEFSAIDAAARMEPWPVSTFAWSSRHPGAARQNRMPFALDRMRGCVGLHTRSSMHMDAIGEGGAAGGAATCPPAAAGSA